MVFTFEQVPALALQPVEQQVATLPQVPSVDTGRVAVDVEEVDVLVDEDCLTVDVVVFVLETVEDLEDVTERLDDFDEDFVETVTRTNELLIDEDFACRGEESELRTGLVDDGVDKLRTDIVKAQLVLSI
ncbi:hypothetical protein EG329_006961 [Mollisiaceae sp. DMI_Dod_QoI]|nr:hypothetical protein EG329_006961 [Helotiales sp. DMI_Dod_QoI]